MFPDLQSVLRLEETPLKGKFIHICEEEDQLGAFLLHHFTSSALSFMCLEILIQIEGKSEYFTTSKLNINFITLGVKIWLDCVTQMS